MPRTRSHAEPDAGSSTTTRAAAPAARHSPTPDSAPVPSYVERAAGGGSPQASPEGFSSLLEGVRDSPSEQAGVLRSLQSGYGNSYVGRVVQAKRAVGRSGDADEQEADRVADQVVAGGRPPDVQRKSDDGAGESVPDGVLEDLGSGRPLDAGTREYFEPRFGQDFSRVRVHTGADAADAARELNALAFTAGDDVVFGEGQYEPQSTSGQRLLAHELAHVVQQSAAPDSAVVQRQPDDGDKGGTGVAGPLADESLWQDELNHWEEEAETADEGKVRAYAARMILLLKNTRPESFRDDEALGDFMADAREKAEDENVTLEALGKENTEGFLREMRAFPMTWSERAGEILLPAVEADELKGRVGPDWAEWQKRADALADHLARYGLPYDIWESLLPVPFVFLDPVTRLAVAAHLMDRVLAGSFDLDAASSLWQGGGASAPVKGYAEALLQYLESGVKFRYVHAWVNTASDVVNDIESGTRFVDYEGYEKYRKERPQGLNGIFDLITIRPVLDFSPLSRETIDLTSAVSSISGVAVTAGSLAVVEGLLKEEPRMFEGLQTRADGVIAGMDGDERMKRGLLWIHEKNFHKAVVEQILKMVEEHAEELAIEAGIEIGEHWFMRLIFRRIPVLGYIYEIYLGVRAIIDAVDAIQSLGDARDAVREAKSVMGLQRASANLALSVANDGAKLGFSLLQIRSVAKTHLGKKGKQAPDDDGGKTAAAAGQAAAKTVKRVPPALADSCTLGSMNCALGIPKIVRNQVKPYPHPDRVPEPKGGFRMRGLRDPEYLALRATRADALRNIVLANPHTWTKEFRAAYKAAGNRWPEDAQGRWQVHHIKPLDFGGDNSPENLIPIPGALHVEYTNWWGSVKNEMGRYFSDAEWDAVIGGSRNIDILNP